MLHYITLDYVTLRYTTLHYVTLLYIKLYPTSLIIINFYAVITFVNDFKHWRCLAWPGLAWPVVIVIVFMISCYFIKYSKLLRFKMGMFIKLNACHMVVIISSKIDSCCEAILLRHQICMYFRWEFLIQMKYPIQMKISHADEKFPYK
uniref:Uncharacterized protein n=1 Tax=Glossina brevipalpis TaxID=37001 RepID=A0A1A9WC02_9MUSC